MVVVKLGVVDPTDGEVPKFYRRISSLPNFSTVSFLKQHAVLLFRGEEETGDVRNVDLNEYQVQLCYKDEDGDKILICNDTDIRDATSNVSTIKIRATVQLKQSTKATQTFIPTNETGTRTNPPDVVDALADLVHCAVASVNAGISQPATKQVKTAARTSSEALQKAMEQASVRTTRAAGKVEGKIAKAVKKAEKSMHKTEKKVEEALAALTRAAEGKGSPHRTVESKRSPDAPSEDLFIHGRHTCDACLTTPILGKRFHATNMIDYDLCETCYHQYKGSEITFELAQLDRDAGLQERWRRKYDCVKKARRCSAVRGPPHVRGPYVRGAPRQEFRHCYRPVDPESDEVALNQAIRESMEDFKAKASAPREEEVNTLEVEEMPPAAQSEVICEDASIDGDCTGFDNADCPETVQSNLDFSSHSNDDDEVALNQALRNSLDEFKASMASEPKEATECAEDDLKVPNAEEAKVEAEDLGDDVSIDTIPKDDESVEVAVEKRAAVPKVFARKSEEECHDTATETGATIVSGKSHDFAPSSPGSAGRTSFVEQDSGSTENFLGETLDRVADAIDNLMIVDGDEDEEESQDSWSVVHEDENLARAAGMIGSALFHSDNNMGSQISSISSVPTDVRSFVNPSQQARWSEHLERLHELGFCDDAKNVSILEMLMAANIGVESDDDVTLEQVVNALMQGN